MAKICPLTNAPVLYTECGECDVRYICAKERLKKMQDEGLKRFVGEVRKFRVDTVSWEYKVIGVVDNRAIVEMVISTEYISQDPVILYWTEGELAEHGFS